jgi:hypothetical protein
MRLYRLKKRSLDTYVGKIFKLGKNRPFVVGLGDATFASSGRGELSMPTCQIGKAFLKAKRKHNHRVILQEIDEFRTTKCCCACSGETTSKVKANGRLAEAAAPCAPRKNSMRLRLCTNCNDSIVKLRDRDVQAARNILWLRVSRTQHEFFGCARSS